MSTPEQEPPLRTYPAQAVADMRGTARWFIAACAAVGGLLLGGVPLTAIGKVTGAGDVTLAVGGLALAMLGVAWAVWHTSEVLSPRFATLRTLERPELRGLREEIAADPAAFFGPFGATAGELDAACRLHASVCANLATLAAGEPDPDRRARAERHLAAARANLAHATRRRAALVELVHAWWVSALLARARRQTLVGAAAVLAGTMLFLLATGGA